MFKCSSNTVTDLGKGVGDMVGNDDDEDKNKGG
jgi:hypothetical protein